MDHYPTPVTMLMMLPLVAVHASFNAVHLLRAMLETTNPYHEELSHWMDATRRCRVASTGE